MPLAENVQTDRAVFSLHSQIEDRLPCKERDIGVLLLNTTSGVSFSL